MKTKDLKERLRLSWIKPEIFNAQKVEVRLSFLSSMKKLSQCTNRVVQFYQTWNLIYENDYDEVKSRNHYGIFCFVSWVSFMEFWPQLCFWNLKKEASFLIARLAWSDPRNSFFSQCQWEYSCAIYSILVYFVMFSFRVLTCLRIVSIHIILILNKFRHVWES